jgi:hypothetical protein
MTSAESAEPAHRGVLMSVSRALRSARRWRETLHAVVGLVAALVSSSAIASLVVMWAAAAWSLVDGPTGSGWLFALYVVVVVASR